MAGMGTAHAEGAELHEVLELGHLGGGVAVKLVEVDEGVAAEGKLEVGACGEFKLVGVVGA